MATCEESVVTTRRADFVSKMELTVKEIKHKFREFHNELFGKEAKLISIVEKIQKDTLEKFDEMSPRLSEIEKGRESLISILTSNSNQKFLDTNLNSFSNEIDSIIGKSRIDRIIELKWKNDGISIGDICQLKVNLLVDPSTQEILNKESGGTSKHEYSSQNYYRRLHDARTNKRIREFYSLNSPHRISIGRNILHNPGGAYSYSQGNNHAFTPSLIPLSANTNVPEPRYVRMDDDFPDSELFQIPSNVSSDQSLFPPHMRSFPQRMNVPFNEDIFDQSPSDTPSDDSLFDPP
eukprot:TRINITY_DN2603_c0_g1_i5.p1 TRINITY_DN2603_c0_g1~~TRINITY_DN2603_c0_g1_i5.p1  ORF type:complete len:293 (+),score=41.15 TRINITY_DN2603_c0_g1_i5:31-909(+)